MAKPDLAADLNEIVIDHFAPGGVDVLEVSIAATGLLTAHLARVSDHGRRRELTDCLVDVIRAAVDREPQGGTVGGVQVARAITLEQ